MITKYRLVISERAEESISVNEINNIYIDDDANEERAKEIFGGWVDEFKDKPHVTVALVKEVTTVTIIARN